MPDDLRLELQFVEAERQLALAARQLGVGDRLDTFGDRTLSLFDDLPPCPPCGARAGNERLNRGVVNRVHRDGELDLLPDTEPQQRIEHERHER